MRGYSHTPPLGWDCVERLLSSVSGHSTKSFELLLSAKSGHSVLMKHCIHYASVLMKTVHGFICCQAKLQTAQCRHEMTNQYHGFQQL